MFSIHQTVKENIAYNEGYSRGQEDAHRYYHMMFTGKQESQNSGGEPMNESLQRELLGEWVDKGYWLKEYPDNTITVGYKDEEFSAVSKIMALPEQLREVCQRHEARLREPAEVKQ